MKKLFHWNNLQEISQIIDSMRQDEVVLGSSDTVLGLFAQISQKSFDRLNAIKGRFDKPYIILASSLEHANAFSPSFQPENMARLAEGCWPGPVTLLVKAREHLPEYVKSANNTIALRVPAHAGLLLLLDKIEGVFSTSANKAGQPVPTNIDGVDPGILAQINHIIVNEEQHISSVASTILDCTGSRIKVVREGAYPIVQLEKMYGHTFIKK